MPYCNKIDLIQARSEELIKDLSNESGDKSESIDDEIVADRIRQADSLIDGYLRGRLPVPIADTPDETPELIKSISTDLSIYYLYKRVSGMLLPDDIKELYKEALRLLKDIQKGVLTIDFPKDEETISAAPTIVKIKKTAADRKFNDDAFIGFD